MAVVLLGLLISGCSGECKKCRGSSTQSPIPVDKIESIVVEFPGTVRLFQDATQVAIVSGPEIAILNINTEVKDGVWRINYPRCITCEENVEITLVVPSIKRIELVSSGNVVADESVQLADLELVNSGSGDIRFDNLKVNTLNIENSGSGKIILKGAQAETVKSKMTGSGEIATYELPANAVEATLTGSGSIFATAITHLKAAISGTGKIYYKGSPAIEQDITGSGELVNSN